MSFRSKIQIFIIFALFSSFFTGCSTKKTTYIKPQKPIRTKAMYRATMKPYTVGFKRYYPTVVNAGERFRGIASWYGDDFHGNNTSNGEYYNMYAATAAHKTLPMNTIVKVTNLKNRKSTIVRVNDRGPFVKSRIIDLSYTAAKDIGMIGAGTAPVELQILSFDGTANSFLHKKPTYTPTQTIVKKSVKLDNFSIQVGSFRKVQGAKTYQQRYALLDNRYNSVIKKFIYGGEPLYRVWLSGFHSEEEARDFMQTNNFNGAIVVTE